MYFNEQLKAMANVTMEAGDLNQLKMISNVVEEIYQDLEEDLGLDTSELVSNLKDKNAQCHELVLGVECAKPKKAIKMYSLYETSDYILEGVPRSARKRGAYENALYMLEKAYWVGAVNCKKGFEKLRILNVDWSALTSVELKAYNEKLNVVRQYLESEIA